MMAEPFNSLTYAQLAWLGQHPEYSLMTGPDQARFHDVGILRPNGRLDLAGAYRPGGVYVGMEGEPA